MSKRKELNWREERKKMYSCKFYEHPNRCHIIHSTECLSNGNPENCAIYESELRNELFTFEEPTPLKRFYMRFPKWRGLNK